MEKIFASPKPRKPLQRTCKNRACRNKFTPTEKHPFAIACCIGCEIILSKRHIEKVQAARAKKERKETAARKDKIKRRSDHLKETQIAFNAFIRERDKGKPCICCNQPLESGNVGGSFDCGHYRSVGSAPHLRFDERNAHGQRKQCNRYGAGRAVDYRVGLIAKLGVEAVESLESDQEPRKWSIDDLKAIKAEYKAKLKALVMDKGVAE
jgi:hypothetical protein